VIVAFADRVGQEEELTYRGESCIINYNGDILTQLDDVSTGIATVKVDPQATLNKSFSDLNDIFTDRRPEIYTR
jgi:predicted amidohydrolase